MRCLIAILATFAIAIPVTGCSDGKTPEVRASEHSAEQQKEIQEQLNDEERQRDNLGIALDSGKWKDGENTFSVGKDAKAQHFAIVGSGKFICYAKMILIPGIGKDLEQQETSSWRLVAVSADFDGNTTIPIAQLPAEIQESATRIGSKKFDQLIKKYRDQVPALAAICGDK